MDATRICLGRFRNLLSSLFRFSLVVLVVIHPGRGEGAESSAVRDWKGGRRFGSQWVAAGDEVRDRDGVHHYQRSAAWVAIRPVPGRSAEEALRGWMDSVGGLDGCELGITIAQGFTLVRLSQVVCQDLLNQPASLQGLLDEARASGWIEAANPVLREEGSKTGLIATEEMVICLSQEVNPRSYFG